VVDLFAQPTLRTNAEAMADNQHTDRGLGIDRWPPHVAIVGPRVRPQPSQIGEPIGLAKQVIVGDVPLEAEAIEALPASPAVRP
jgi:hypothetical protein